MKNKAFEILQKLGRSFMLPIAVLPAAGLLLGIGSSFTNITNLNNLGVLDLMGPGTLAYSIFSIMSGVGSAVFDNLPIIFAIGVAIGMANKDKETAALAAALAYLVMNVTINKILVIKGMIDEAGNAIGNMPQEMFASTLGITSLQIGVFGGVVVGVGVSILHNKYRNVSLPTFLAFFGGNRFIPILAVFVYIIVGFVFTIIWPPIQNGIIALGQLIAKGGAVGAFFFDFIKRLLIPFGLHHVFYMPFWQTALGGVMEVAGTQYLGAQNILFAQLADPNTAHISRNAAMYFMGEYPMMIFGVPFASYAIYKNAKKKNKKETKSLMISIALTSVITGITEPFEFPVLFASPILYLFHSILSGLSNVCLYLLNVGVGCTFSDGLIDLLLLGILPGNAKTSWIYIILVGIVVGFVYYFVFDFAIKKYDLKTPGREDINNEVKINAVEGDASELIAMGLGGKRNIVSVDCCATRLRVVVKDGGLVSEAELKNTGSLGIVRKDTNIQVIYGTKVNIVKDKLEDYLASANHNVLLRTPIVGKYIKLEEVPDEAFASKTMGDGVAVEPVEDTVYAPDNGTIEFIYPTKHAIGFRTDSNIYVLIHIGLDTVNLKGEGFTQLVNVGDKVSVGTPIMKLDLDYLRKNAKSLISPIIITELQDDEKLEIIADENIEKDESIVRIVRK